MATGVQAVRVGIVMFTIPFVFAFYPELLLIEQAQFAPSIDGSLSDKKTYLPGYDGTVQLEALGWLVLRLVVALYLVASALSRFDAARLSMYEVALRPGSGLSPPPQSAGGRGNGARGHGRLSVAAPRSRETTPNRMTATPSADRLPHSTDTAPGRPG